MTFDQAIALQPAWVGIWINILGLGAFVLPLTLLIWRQSRRAAFITIAVNLIAAPAIFWLYGQMGYVKLLGLPHVLLWTPLLIFLYTQYQRPDMPAWPQRILIIVMTVLLISLIFDYMDVLRYILGDRMPFPGTAP